MHGLWQMQTGRDEGMKWLAKRRFNFIDTTGFSAGVHQWMVGEWAFGVLVLIFMFLLSCYVESAANRVTKK